MKQLFDDVSFRFSQELTRSYSTSFSWGIRCLHPGFRQPVYALYGFVRLADEIVDSFHDYDKKKLLDNFRKDTYAALNDRISVNPVLNSFQHIVHEYNIDPGLINGFLKSMEMDLCIRSYDKQGYDDYILGSAEVVGLMCLRIFVKGDEKEYERLKKYAMKLGAAFQKVNFLRDLKADYFHLGRMYFPGVSMEHFNEVNKKEIERSIEEDFRVAFEGIKLLPKSSRFGVYVAYIYYRSLFDKIKGSSPERILSGRIRIPNNRKLTLLLSSYVKHSFDLI